MTYDEALKAVQSKKTRENLMVINLDYDKKIILPFKDGISLMAALNNAERLHAPYGKSPRISSLDRELIESTVMSYDEYEEIKVAALLQLSPEEVREAAKQTVWPTKP